MIRTATGTSPRRKASKEVRRHQLIEATVKVLARKGYAALTVADVAKAACLSTGIIMFHFGSKDQLLAEVLRHLAEEYRQNWTEALARAGRDQAARLLALTLSDFDPVLYTSDKLSAWIAFWGETQGRPVYDQICASYDAERQAACLDCCVNLIAAGQYPHDPRLTMQGIEALCDGLWLATAGHGTGLGTRVTPADAHRIIRASLAAFFPRHFPLADE